MSTPPENAQGTGDPAFAAGPPPVTPPPAEPAEEVTASPEEIQEPAEAAEAEAAAAEAAGDTAGAAAARAEAEEAKVEEDPVASAKAEAEKYLALAQRTQADFDNFRRRAARDQAAAIDRGVTKLAKELLPALDHLQYALAAAKDDESELAKGIRLVQDEVTAALGRVGIQAFSPEGEPFDPNEHDAMVQQPREGYEPGTVAEVYQAGYRLNGAVLRPARVVVAA